MFDNIVFKPQVESSKQIFNSTEASKNVPHSPTSDEEYLSDYIQNHHVPLPHLGAADDDIQVLETNGNNDDGDRSAEQWQKNWVFKKRDNNDDDDINGTDDLVTIANSNSIGMLVPSPTEEVRALIGDQTADEVSDLSEAGSGDESELSDEENRVTIHVDIPHVIVESNTLIGGKNAMGSFHQTLLLPQVFLNTDEVPKATMATDIESNIETAPLKSEECTGEVQVSKHEETAAQIETIPFPVPAPR